MRAVSTYIFLAYLSLRDAIPCRWSQLAVRVRVPRRIHKTLIAGMGLRRDCKCPLRPATGVIP